MRGFDCKKGETEQGGWKYIVPETEIRDILIEAAKHLGVGMISYGSELNMLNAGCKKIKEMF